MQFLSHNLEMYTFNFTVHGINTRNKPQLHKSKVNLTLHQKIFNELPECIAKLAVDKKNTFISTLKSYIFKKSFHSLEELIND